MKHIFALLLCFSLAASAYTDTEIKDCKDFMKIIKITESLDFAKTQAIKKALETLPKEANDNIKKYLREQTDQIDFQELEDKIAECILKHFDSKDINEIINMNNAQADSFYKSKEWDRFMDPKTQNDIFKDIGEIVKEALTKKIKVDEIKDRLNTLSNRK